MDLIYVFDANRFQLGKLCKHGHAWPGTNQSLRRIPYTCVGCTGRKEADWLLSFLDYEAMGWPQGHRLGKICAGGHRYENLDATLRINGRCKECEESPEKLQRKRDRLAARLASDPALREHRRAQQSSWWNNRSDEAKALARARDNSVTRREKRRINKAEIRESLREQGLTAKGTVPTRTDGGVQKGEKNELVLLNNALQSAIRNAGRSTVARLVMDEQRRYWRENPEEKRRHDKEWDQNSWWLKYRINPELRLYHREKARRRKAQDRGQTPVQISVAALCQRFNEFGNCCAYCGDGGDMQAEHVEPISKGGAHDIGNIVPACWPCNASKRTSNMEDWYRSQPFFSELRLHRIRRVMRQPEAYQLAMM